MYVKLVIGLTKTKSTTSHAFKSRTNVYTAVVTYGGANTLFVTVSVIVCKPTSRSEAKDASTKMFVRSAEIVMYGSEGVKTALMGQMIEGWLLSTSVQILTACVWVSVV